MSAEVTCKKCGKSVVPQVVPSPSGLTGRFCPACGAPMDNVLHMDAAQVRAPAWMTWALLVLGLAVAGYLAYLTM